jgi:hypothetical protein
MNPITSELGNKILREKIDSLEPFIATKMGGVEQNIIDCKFRNDFNPIRMMAQNNAGISPPDDFTLNYFYDLYTKSLSNSDMIGLMGLPNEKTIIEKFSKDSIVSELRYLEPFYFEDPWSQSLKNKKVLVIHPFENSIINQYKKRDKLFLNTEILPDFELLTIKSEQTNGGGRRGSKNFIESLEVMMKKIDSYNFDISLVGCGAYGLILSNYIKEKKKQVVHIGGGLQILFGIKGKRWDSHPEISKLYNQDWIRPSEDEKTLNINLVEGGTYW